MNLTIQQLKLKQQQQKAKQKEQNEKLTKLISNNNILIRELNKLEQTNTNTEERLKVLKSDLEYVEDLYTDLFSYLSDTYDQLKYLQEKKKSMKNSNSTKKELKKPTKKSKPKTIREATTEEDISRFKRMMNFLLAEYEKQITVSK
ncbi:hypothetical protein EC54115_25594 [Escherichia coli 541-15]|jgi:predicted nuclease with TOPRIM domain|nr:hypothetical protein EC54115_25594 [Escherichia coli 541-15]